MNAKLILSVLLGALLAASAASALADIVSEAEVARYVAAGGEDLREMRLYKMRSWRVLDDHRLIVWNERRDPYLITVREPCTKLEFASSLGVTSFMHRVMPRTDSVLLRNQRCRIDRIQSLDREAVNAIERARAAGEFSD